MHPIITAVAAPLLRLQQASPGEKMIGLIGGLWVFITTDAFILSSLLLVGSGTADTIYGRSIHKQLGTFDTQKAEIGFHSKIMGLVMVLLIRGFEVWWTRVIVGSPLDGLYTNGFLSMAVALTLFISDLKSIEEKRVRFGQAPLPVIGRVLNTLDGFASVLGAGPNGKELIDRRATDDVDSRRSTDCPDSDQGEAIK